MKIIFKYTCAPVSVAMSNITLALRSLDAYTTPSDKTRRPSASVLLISTVLKLQVLILTTFNLVLIALLGMLI